MSPAVASSDVLSGSLDRFQLSQALGQSLPTLDRFVRDGLVPPGFKIGKHRRWLRSEVTAWLEAGAPNAKDWEEMKKGAR